MKVLPYETAHQRALFDKEAENLRALTWVDDSCRKHSQALPLLCSLSPLTPRVPATARANHDEVTSPIAILCACHFLSPDAASYKGTREHILFCSNHDKAHSLLGTTRLAEGLLIQHVSGLLGLCITNLR